MYGYYFDAISKLTRDQGAARTNIRMYMYIRMRVAAFIHKAYIH